jgi:two-component system nitrate/nitrite response regulator NarL
MGTIHMAPTAGIDVLVVAGVRLYREGLVQALAGDPRFRVAGAAADHAEALAVARRLQPSPSVVLLDIGGAGLDSARRLRAALPGLRLVALVIDDTDESVVAWAEAGVVGFVTRDTSLEDLLTTVECVARGGGRCSERGTAALVRRLTVLADRRRPEARRGTLTPREREVVALIDRGMSNKQIACELHIELTTVKNHVHSVLEKLHVERRSAAAAVMRGRD